MDRFARVVLGYHGCTPAFAEAVLRGELSTEEWQASQNPFDWLGHGIYFWEYGPERALKWGGGGIIGAMIQLGNCLDLTDVYYTTRLRGAYLALQKAARQQGTSLPKNRGKRRDRDCFVINRFVSSVAEGSRRIQTARCPFLEGIPAYPGSAIRRESHIQLVVFDKQCLLGVFRPVLQNGTRSHE
jgi:hypothetical protein